VDPGNPRQLRMSLIADALAERGNDVVWWSAAYHHTAKRYREAVSPVIAVRPRYEVRLLSGLSYRSNVSFRRLINHAQLGWRFRREARRPVPPDVVLCSFPIVELAWASVAYARQRRIPVIVDVRDLWPDILVDVAPRFARPLARLALTPMFRMARGALAGASAIVAVSSAYMSWALAYAHRSATPRDRVIPHG
jgi:hypothetical protein